MKFNLQIPKELNHLKRDNRGYPIFTKVLERDNLEINAILHDLKNAKRI